MALERDFAQILQEKMGVETSKTEKSTPSPSQTQEFPAWEYQFFTSQRTYIPSEIPRIYPRPQPKKTIHVPPKKVRPAQEPTCKIGEIGMEYSSDLITLQGLGADLDPAALSLSTVKTAYRKLARQWHPDRNGSPEAGKYFQLATESYDRLVEAMETLFKI